MMIIFEKENEIEMKATLKIFTVCILLFLSGCESREMLDLQEFVENTHKDKVPSIDPLPKPKPHPTYRYAASNMPDPFDVTNIAPQKKVELKDPRDALRRREELESFSLDSIRVVGTLTVAGEKWAVVTAPDGTTHRIKRGRYMGENDGRVVDIDLDEQKVTLVEDVRSATGEWVKREVFLSVDDE